MSYNIVLTTAEDIVAVVDAVIAKGSEAAKDFIAEFTGIATDDQVLKALQMACELQLIVFDSSRGCYGSPSFLARKLVSASSDEQKAVFMRLILEQYAPYNTFKTRYGFTKSIELACRQTKTLHMMTSNERDVKNTLISIATYAKALKSEGANLYSFARQTLPKTRCVRIGGKICILLLIHPMCLPLWLRHCRKLILGQWMFVLSLFVQQMHLNLF